MSKKVMQQWEIETHDTTFVVPVFCTDGVPMDASKFGDCYRVVNHVLEASDVKFNPEDIEDLRIISSVKYDDTSVY